MLRAEVRRVAKVVIQGLGQRRKAIALRCLRLVDAIAVLKGGLLGVEPLRRLLLAHHDCARRRDKLLC